jgi:ribose transport system permease protein
LKQRCLKSARQAVSAFASLYGMLAVLLLLGLFFSWATYREESPIGQAAAALLSDQIGASVPKNSPVVIVGTADQDSTEFTTALQDSLTKAGYQVRATLRGDPPSVREGLEALSAKGEVIRIVATTRACRDWSLWSALKRSSPAFRETRVLAPGSIRRSTFLSANNLRNIGDQIAVIAIIAVGMTMVIITGGIDLSVGSLVALSAVLTAWLIQKAGGERATLPAMVGACMAAIALCGVVGGFSGWLVARFRVPSFIVTLAGMQIASGMAFIVSRGQSIYDMPLSFTWLGRSATLLTLPNAVLLMVFIYIGAHIFMSRTRYGRYIYAVGGNMEAARLSAVPLTSTLVFVYVISALLAGVGGVITASQLKAGAPTYGAMYEMYVIAAVVVGGTSLTGGSGRVLGTLIGAFVIAVIRNGMNLMDVEPYTQKVLLGAVILGAVLVDMARQRRALKKARHV